MNIQGKSVHISYRDIPRHIRHSAAEESADRGKAGMAVWDTIFKAVFVVAVPITLVVYACMYVGERAEHDVARPHPPRRRPPGD